jgi:hypothetical protein
VAGKNGARFVYQGYWKPKAWFVGLGKHGCRKWWRIMEPGQFVFRKDKHMSKQQLRQLDWWEVLQPGDWQVIAGDNIFRRTKYCLGWTVDRAFGFYRKVGETVLFYRKVETK